MMTSPRPVKFHLLRCQQLSIYEQLQLEEALLRADDRNWCLINAGTPPAIVMGISGKAEQLVDSMFMSDNPVPLIRRFSGGGTVYVDGDTHFVTWICNTAQLGVDGCPAKVHRWAADFYQAALPEVGMQLRENDYVIGERKWGGNAQYLCKGRWLHHTSMLWNYNALEMQRLLMPTKAPIYRQGRSHDEFLCRLCEYIPSRDQLEKQLLKELYARFDVEGVDFEEAKKLLTQPHRRATMTLT